jgi:hypothetical protein
VPRRKDEVFKISLMIGKSCGELVGRIGAQFLERGCLIERGGFDAALSAARDNLPLLAEAGCAWTMLDDENAMLAARKTSRTMPAIACISSCENLVAHELDRLLAESARFTDDEACRVAIETQ